MTNTNTTGTASTPTPTSTQNGTSEESSGATLMTTLSTSSSVVRTWTYSEGGYDYELVGVSDSRYECPICLVCLRDPVLTTCGHKFCNSCIREWVETFNGKCPVDGVSLSHENIFPDNYTRREIMQSKARCPFANSGCEAVLSLSEMDRHIHVDHASSLSSDKTNGSGFPSAADVVDCRFKEYGCDVRVHPSEIQRHLQADVHKHLNLMMMAYRRLKVCSTSRSNLEHPTDPFWSRQDSRESQRWLLEDSWDSDDYEFRRQRSWDSVRFAQNKHNARVRPRFLPPRLAESDESLCKTHSTQGGNAEGAETSLALQGQVTCSATGSRQFNDLYERLVQLEQNDMEKQIKIDRLQSELTRAVNLFSSATNIIKDLTARYCHGVFVWTIPEFRKLCLEMRKDPNRFRHSTGFYTDTFGYKLCLRFNLTTPSSHGAVAPVDVPLEHDKDTFISLYVHFMKGEFDETLRWPFRGEMSLLLIHPSNPEQSILETIIAKPGQVAYDKPVLPRNPTGIGFTEFCPINKALLEGFVRNDTLVCKIIAKGQHVEHSQ